MPDQEAVKPASKLPWIIAGLVALALAWFIPSHIRLIRERDELKTKVSTYEKHSHTETHKKPVALPNGQVGYEEDTVTDNDDKGRIAESDKKKDKVDVTVDRGTVSITAYWGTDKPYPVAASAAANIIGPFGFEAYGNWNNKIEVLVGPRISF